MTTSVGLLADEEFVAKLKAMRVDGDSLSNLFWDVEGIVANGRSQVSSNAICIVFRLGEQRGFMAFVCDYNESTGELTNVHICMTDDEWMAKRACLFIGA